MSEEEIEINAAYAELQNLRAELAALHNWADRVLDNENTDRQYIAEHLSTACGVLAFGGPMPRRPYDDIDEF
ncbi:hypothetical protein KZ829_03055 [Actinoplanes hulinensis]|uniref:Uncharacterized protein n=1 Tax=Actinoplanes hulinensis TaxID=1144547 RepID=A0ABS7AVE2_9ACTN|nr:hypothetical protein [Actinoplanes hulinensis]MBW6432718.1 hypothetical protein [Actinoplanes hulinensis]